MFVCVCEDSIKTTELFRKTRSQFLPCQACSKISMSTVIVVIVLGVMQLTFNINREPLGTVVQILFKGALNLSAVGMIT